jgi:cell fate regulator YaaT (PSP1 superfamily)
MAELVGVHFRNAGKIYYLAAGDLIIHMNDKVICMTQRGMEYGVVRTSSLDKGFTIPEEEDSEQVVIRIATQEDIEKERENRKAEDEAYKICKQKIAEHELEMKLVEAQYTFDRKKLTFYFLADGRVDFRALVKDLASSFHTRIELRQIGVRDETKIVGGIGVCGRELCCATFLNAFSPVSIKMAKEQNLSLNPTKISGVCGRLMCCLKNEEEAYEELNKKLPRRGDEVATKDGKTGEVHSVDVLREKIRVFFEEDDNREVKEFNIDELVFDPSVHKKSRRRRMEQDSSSNQNEDVNTKNQSLDKKEDGENQNNDNKNRNTDKIKDKRDNRKNRDNRENRYNNRNTTRENNDKDGSNNNNSKDKRPFKDDKKVGSKNNRPKRDAKPVSVQKDSKNFKKNKFKDSRKPNKNGYQRNKDSKNQKFENEEY